MSGVLRTTGLSTMCMTVIKLIVKVVVVIVALVVIVVVIITIVSMHRRHRRGHHYFHGLRGVGVQRQTGKSRAGRHVWREADGKDGHEGYERRGDGGNIFQRPHENRPIELSIVVRDLSISDKV